MKIFWRPKAEADFAAQIAHVFQESASGARRLQAAVLRSVSLLATFPRLGRLTPMPGVRELVVPRTPFILVYQVEGRSITIVRLFHARQDR